MIRKIKGFGMAKVGMSIGFMQCWLCFGHMEVKEMRRFEDQDFIFKTGILQDYIKVHSSYGQLLQKS